VVAEQGRNPPFTLIREANTLSNALLIQEVISDTIDKIVVDRAFLECNFLFLFVGYIGACFSEGQT
jgi:hypothetical protein